MIAKGLEEIKALAGQDLGFSEWVQIDQQRIDAFANASGDHQWIHVDAERAKDGPFGATIAHGYLTLSLLVPLFGELLDIQGTSMSINYGLERVRFPSPVVVGSKVRLTGTTASVEDVAGDGVQMLIDFTMQIEGKDKPACIARAIYRHYT